MSSITNEIGLYMLWTVCDINKNYELQKTPLALYPSTDIPLSVLFWTDFLPIFHLFMLEGGQRSR